VLAGREDHLCFLFPHLRKYDRIKHANVENQNVKCEDACCHVDYLLSTQEAGGQQLESEIKSNSRNVRFDDGADDYPPLRVPTEEFGNHAQLLSMLWDRPFSQNENGLEDLEKQAGQQHEQNVTPIVLQEGSQEEYVLLAEGLNLQLIYHALVLSDPVVGLRIERINH